MAEDLYSRTLKENGRTEKEKEIKKKRNKLILSLVIVAVFVIVILSMILPKKSSTLVTGFIQNGSLEKTASGTATFLRHETVVEAESKGKIIAAIKEGERASKDEVVAYITTPDQEETALELIKIDTQIVAADTYSDSTFTTLLSGGGQLSEAITGTLIHSSADAVKGSLRDYSDKEAGLDTYFALKNGLSQDVSSKEEYVNKLLEKKEALLQKMGSKTRTLVAKEPGIVSYCVDGNEEFFNEMEDFEAVRAFDIKDIKGNGESKNGTTVERGEPVFKILSDYDYYAFVKMPGYKSGEVSNGTTITVQADNREFSFKGNVVRFEKDADGAEVLLRCTSSQPSTVSYRTRNVDLILQSVKGMKVPVRALTDWDSAKVTAKITLIRANCVESLFVNVDSYNDEYAIISNRDSFGEDTVRPASANDMYVQNPDKVNIGELLE